MTAMTTRAKRSQTSYHAGRAAEESVSRNYARRGYRVAESRWRGKAGEVDLIFRDGDGFVFVEVKKSADFARAAARVSRQQMDRLCRAGSEYVTRCPKGQLTPQRYDVALVNDAGEIEILENAFMEM